MILLGRDVFIICKKLLLFCLFWADVARICKAEVKKHLLEGSCGQDSWARKSNLHFLAKKYSPRWSQYAERIITRPCSSDLTPLSPVSACLSQSTDSLSLVSANNAEWLKACMSKYTCSHCGKGFSFSGNRSRHEKVCQQMQMVHMCSLCDQAFARNDNLKTHMRQLHGIGEQLICSVCGTKFRSKIKLDEHKLVCQDFHT